MRQGRRGPHARAQSDNPRMPVSPVFTPLPSAHGGCPLCQTAGGTLLGTRGDWRVVRVDDPSFPAFYRVIAQHHVAEFSELLAPERQRGMDLVCAVERLLIERLRPTKVNLASLGNVVPHLHWHVIARFDWDSHFPQPVWAGPQRAADEARVSECRARLPEIDSAIVELLQRA